VLTDYSPHLNIASATRKFADTALICIRNSRHP
jgi:hypothetical protein